MVRTVLTSLFCLWGTSILAQSQFTHTIVSSKSATLPARDFWFTMPRNYESQAGKYYQLHITSRVATTVNLQVAAGTDAGKAVPLADAYDFGCIPVGAMRDSLIRIYAFVDALTVDTMWIDNVTYFQIVDLPTFPFVIQQGGYYDIRVRFQANVYDSVKSILRVITVEHGESHTTVKGCGLNLGNVRPEISATESDLRASLERGNAFAWLTPTPNPIDRGTSVRFTFGLARSGEVALEIHDLPGKQVATIPASRYDAGVHELSFATNSIPPGTYLYRYMAFDTPYSGMFSVR